MSKLLIDRIVLFAVVLASILLSAVVSVQLSEVKVLIEKWAS